jgi:hypothetical protein
MGSKEPGENAKKTKVCEQRLPQFESEQIFDFDF